MRGDRRAFWEILIRDQADSALSIREFCEQAGVSQPSFYQWRKRLRREALVSGPSFLPVSVRSRAVKGDSHESGSIEVEFPDGIVVRIPSGMLPETVRVVLAAVSGETAC